MTDAERLINTMATAERLINTMATAEMQQIIQTQQRMNERIRELDNLIFDMTCSMERSIFASRLMAASLIFYGVVVLGYFFFFR